MGPPVPIYMDIGSIRILSYVLYDVLYLAYYSIILRNIASFYGSSCANNAKGALNTPEPIMLRILRRMCTVFRVLHQSPHSESQH